MKIRCLSFWDKKKEKGIEDNVYIYVYMIKIYHVYFILKNFIYIYIYI